MLLLLLALSRPVEAGESSAGGAIPEPHTQSPEELDWVAPAQCPSSRQLRSAIERRLGRRLEPNELMLRGRVESVERGYVLHLETAVGERRDARTLHGKDCRTLTEAAALISALSVDAVQTAVTVLGPAEASPSVRQPRPDAAARAVPSVATPAPSVDAGFPTEPDEATRPMAALGAHGGLSLGVTPDPGAIVSLRFAVSWPRFAVELGGHYVTPSTASRAIGGVRVQMGAGDIRACARLRQGRLDVPLCGGFEVGAMRGDGRRTTSVRTRHGLWLAPVVSAGLWGWLHARVALGGGAEAAMPFLRPAFDLRDPGPARELFTPWPVAIRILGGLRVALTRP